MNIGGSKQWSSILLDFPFGSFRPSQGRRDEVRTADELLVMAYGLGFDILAQLLSPMLDVMFLMGALLDQGTEIPFQSAFGRLLPLDDPG